MAEKRAPPPINNLQDLIHTLTWLSDEGCTRKEIFEWLYDFTRAAGIMFRYRVCGATGDYEVKPPETPAPPKARDKKDPQKKKWIPLEYEIIDGRLYLSDPSDRSVQLPPLPGFTIAKKPPTKAPPAAAKDVSPNPDPQAKDTNPGANPGAGPNAKAPVNTSRSRRAKDPRITLTAKESGRFDFLDKGIETIGLVHLSVINKHIAPRLLAMPLIAECNGAVIDAATWRLLVIPPKAFVRTSRISEIPPGARVTTIDDGTIVSLYCWKHPVHGPTWCISSANGYDVSAYLWSGEKTYAEVIVDLANSLGLGNVFALIEDKIEDKLAGKFTSASSKSGPANANANAKATAKANATANATAKANATANSTANATANAPTEPAKPSVRLQVNSDPDYSHTIGFRHHDFHPLTRDPQKIWYVQGVCIPESRVVMDHVLTGVPPAREVSPQEALELVHESALASALRSIAAGKPQFNYGIMVRTNTSDPDRLVGTDLLSFLRRVIYENRPGNAGGANSGANSAAINHTNRVRHNLLRAFIDQYKPSDIPQKTILRALFQQYDQFFRQITDFLDSVKTQTLDALRAKNIGITEPTKNTPLRFFALGLAKEIQANEPKFNPFIPSAIETVNDYVHQKDYALRYLTIMKYTAV